jgi:hypothetical protein
MSTKDLFISGDIGDLEYCKLIFGIQLKFEAKALKNKTYYLLHLGLL